MWWESLLFVKLNYWQLWLLVINNLGRRRIHVNFTGTILLLQSRSAYMMCGSAFESGIFAVTLQVPAPFGSATHALSISTLLLLLASESFGGFGFHSQLLFFFHIYHKVVHWVIYLRQGGCLRPWLFILLEENRLYRVLLSGFLLIDHLEELRGGIGDTPDYLNVIWLLERVDSKWSLLNLMLSPSVSWKIHKFLPLAPFLVQIRTLPLICLQLAYLCKVIIRVSCRWRRGPHCCHQLIISCYQ
jgi:hypothetical protein